MCDSAQGSLCLCSSQGNTSKHVDKVTIFQKLNQKANDPYMTFDLTSVEVTQALYPRIIVFNAHGKTSMKVDTLTIFQKL